MFSARRIPISLVLLFVLAVGVLGCRRQTPEAPEAYTPGLGEIMTLTQMRHVKLWLAGEATNWALAAYEVDELAEGFDDAVKFHPTHKSSPVPLSKVIPLIMDRPMVELRAAIDKKDSADFARAFTELTAACNSCHQATNFGFNVVQRPTSNPFPNQAFQAP